MRCIRGTWSPRLPLTGTAFRLGKRTLRKVPENSRALPLNLEEAWADAQSQSPVPAVEKESGYTLYLHSIYLLNTGVLTHHSNVIMYSYNCGACHSESVHFVNNASPS